MKIIVSCFASLFFIFCGYSSAFANSHCELIELESLCRNISGCIWIKELHLCVDDAPAIQKQFKGISVNNVAFPGYFTEKRTTLRYVQKDKQLNLFSMK